MGEEGSVDGKAKMKKGKRKSKMGEEISVDGKGKIKKSKRKTVEIAGKKKW